MIYDIEGHVLHVNQSPFTCYSWEKNKPLTGLSLNEIYPVVSLQYSDFIESRRGISSYVKDLKKGAISFRKYDFENQKPIVVEDYFTLDMKLKCEFSYHITFNLLRNFYSILDQKNIALACNFYFLFCISLIYFYSQSYRNPLLLNNQMHLVHKV